MAIVGRAVAGGAPVVAAAKGAQAWLAGAVDGSGIVGVLIQG